MRGQMTHLEPDALAEFRAGLITGRHGALISAHLAGCDRCTALGDELAQVSALLAAVPGPAMPDSVAQRLDIALAAEVAKRDYSERADGERPGKRKSWRRPAWARDFRLVALRVLAPAAAVLLAAGGYGLSQLGGGPTTQAASSSAAQAVSAAPRATKAASGAGNSVSAPLSGIAPTARSHRMPPAVFPVVIQPATFKQQVEAALRTPASARKTPASSATMRACVHALAGGVQPVMVEIARYQGQPATLIVVPTRQGDTAWLVGARCSAANHDVLAHATVPSGISGP